MVAVIQGEWCGHTGPILMATKGPSQTGSRQGLWGGGQLRAGVSWRDTHLVHLTTMFLSVSRA